MSPGRGRTRPPSALEPPSRSTLPSLNSTLTEMRSLKKAIAYSHHCTRRSTRTRTHGSTWTTSFERFTRNCGISKAARACRCDGSLLTYRPGEKRSMRRCARRRRNERSRWRRRKGPGTEDEEKPSADLAEQENCIQCDVRLRHE